MPSPPQQPRPLRGDAQRNRDRLLAAARELFAARGVDVAMADIARHAGVSNGTLYNRFPARENLIEAVFTDRLEAMAALARQALADDDPWRGLTGYLTAVCELQADDRGFNEVAARGLPPPPRRGGSRGKGRPRSASYSTGPSGRARSARTSRSRT